MPDQVSAPDQPSRDAWHGGATMVYLIHANLVEDAPCPQCDEYFALYGEVSQ